MDQAIKNSDEKFVPSNLQVSLNAALHLGMFSVWFTWEG